MVLGRVCFLIMCQSHFIMYMFYFNMKKGGFPPQKVTMKKVKNMI